MGLGFTAMATERRDGVTPNGGAYTLATFIDLATMAEVDKDRATGIVIAEYDENDNWLGEMVGQYVQPTSG